MTTVFCTEDSARLDVFLTDETDFTRSHIKRLIDDARVFIGGVPATKAGQSVRAGDEVSFEDFSGGGEMTAEDVPLDIVYDDAALAVINKQRGLVVHPGAGNPSGTLVNALMYRYGDDLSKAGGALRAGIVHRLDKDTTGLIVIAKTDGAHARLSAQFASDSGRVETYINRDRRNRLKMAVASDGRRAVTGYSVLERFKRNCYAEFELFTGRTHQIRVHASHLGHPIACDALYGGSMRLGASGQLLHSRTLEFTHPTTGERMRFTAAEPQDFADALARLRGNERA